MMKFFNELTISLVLVSFINWVLNPFTLSLRSAQAGNFSVMIIPLSESDLTGAFVDQMAKAFKDTGRFDVIARSEVEDFLESKKGETPKRNLNSVFNEATELLKKGEGLYNGLKIDEAIDILQQAKIKFKEAMPLIESEADYSRFLGTYFYLSMAYQSKKLMPQAEQELYDMVVLDPQRKIRKFSSKYYPPGTLDLYEQVRKKVLKGKTAKLELRTNPKDASVYLDGVMIGNTPTDSSGLPLGEHFITFKRQGFVDWSDSKFVVEGKNIVDVDLKSKSSSVGFVQARPVKSSYDMPRDVARMLDELSVSLGGDVFLLYEWEGGLKSGRLKAQIYDQRNQEVSNAEEVKVDNLDQPGSSLSELAQKLVSYMSTEGYVTGGQKSERKDIAEERPPELKPEEGSPSEDNIISDSAQDWQTLPPKKPGPDQQWYEKWWIWTIIGGSLLVAGGSVLLFTDIAKSPASKSTFVVNK